MSNIAIRASGVSKRYRLGGIHVQANYRRLTETIMDIFNSVLANQRHGGGPASSKEQFWALKDVSFEVHHGEALGIIGRNGAGKSTLLKILSRITKPTQGRIELNGRVGSLLEVGTGFHNELTGRENIYLSGAILGMRRTEIRRKFDEIVAFAEIEKFIDTPVKRYSSGMYMRLAFSVAAHLEPEILLIDEVLAVGDTQFQKKCLGKMGDIARGGRTVLFVSHNLSAVTNLCPKTYWLDGGRVKEYGDTSRVVQHYLSRRTQTAEIDLVQHPGRRTSHTLMRGLRLLSNNEPSITFRTHSTFCFEVECSGDLAVMKGMSLGFNIKDLIGNMLFASHLNQYQPEIQVMGNRVQFQAVIDSLPLSPGSYELSLYLAHGKVDIDIIEGAASFDVIWDSELGLEYPPMPDWGPLFSLVDWQAREVD